MIFYKACLIIKLANSNSYLITCSKKFNELFCKKLIQNWSITLNKWFWCCQYKYNLVFERSGNTCRYWIGNCKIIKMDW